MCVCAFRYFKNKEGVRIFLGLVNQAENKCITILCPTSHVCMYVMILKGNMYRYMH